MNILAIGTAHGAYKAKPCLDIERLKEIRKKLIHRLFSTADRDFLTMISEIPLKRELQRLIYLPIFVLQAKTQCNTV